MDENERDGLYNLVDYLKANPNVPTPTTISVWTPNGTVNANSCRYISSFEKFDADESDKERREKAVPLAKEWIGSVARKLIGTGVKIEKEYAGSIFALKARGEKFTISYTVEREVMCTKVVKSTKIVPECYVPGRIEKAHIEEEVVWVCDDGTVLKK